MKPKFKPLSACTICPQVFRAPLIHANKGGVKSSFSLLDLMCMGPHPQPFPRPYGTGEGRSPYRCRFFSPWELLTTPTILPLKRGGVEGVPSTKFFLFISLPAPLGPMVQAKKPSKAGQKLRKRGVSGGAAPSQPPPLRRGGAPPDLPRPREGPNIATE